MENSNAWRSGVASLAGRDLDVRRDDRGIREPITGDRGRLAF